MYVILSDGRRGSPQNSPPQYRIEQLPNGFTTGELADQLSQSASEANGHLRMLVSPLLFCCVYLVTAFLTVSACKSRGPPCPARPEVIPPWQTGIVSACLLEQAQM